MEPTVTELPRGAAPVDEAMGRSTRRSRAADRLRRRWWVGAGAISAMVGSLLIPVTASGPIAAAPSEGLECVNPIVSHPVATTTLDAFLLTAKDGYISTPDGNSIYMWGYAAGNGGFQYPGPNLCVNQGDTVSVTLKNTLAVPTSIVFNGLVGVTADGAHASPDAVSLTKSAGATGGSVTYQFTADHAGTFLYESGTNPTIQDQMGLVGALVVRPALHHDYLYDDPGTTVASAGATTYTATTATDPAATWAANQWVGHTVRIVGSQTVATVASNTGQTLTLDPAINDPSIAYNAGPATGWSIGNAYRSDTPAAGAKFEILALDTRFQPPALPSPKAGTAAEPAIATMPHEYMHLLTEIDPDLHHAFEVAPTGSFDMSKYKARYFMINGRSFPDTLAPNNAQQLPTQPYGSLVHVLPRTIDDPLPAAIRYLNAGPVTYPFHPHSNHEKVVGIDGHEMVSQLGAAGGNPADISQDRYGITIAPGQTLEAMFSWVDAQSWNATANPVGVPVPGQEDRFEGPFWNGSPYLGDREPLSDGVVRYNQCGEFYHVAHSHALFEVTNFGFSGGGMLTMVRIDPPLGTTGTAARLPRTDCTVPAGN